MKQWEGGMSARGGVAAKRVGEGGGGGGGRKRALAGHTSEAGWAWTRGVTAWARVRVELHSPPNYARVLVPGQ